MSVNLTIAGGLHTANRAQVTIENCLFTGNYAWACGGATLNSMSNGATKQGDGQPWKPTITVKGGTSGFYSIKVGK